MPAAGKIEKKLARHLQEASAIRSRPLSCIFCEASRLILVQDLDPQCQAWNQSKVLKRCPRFFW